MLNIVGALLCLIATVVCGVVMFINYYEEDVLEMTLFGFLALANYLGFNNLTEGTK